MTPWKLDSDYIWEGENCILAGVYNWVGEDGRDASADTHHYNAILRKAAAAPEMEAAIAEALSHCGEGGYLDCGKPATDRLRAALAKAQ